jgi:aminoglycoside phosphotransferase (APT) family kinase protein
VGDDDRCLRERAIHELAATLEALHATPADGLDAASIAPPHTMPLARLLELIDRLRKPGRDALLDACAAFVQTRWDAFDDRDRGLAHGDPHLENVLWDGEHVTALLDLEWASPTWLHADLEILLAVAGDPRRYASEDHEASVDRRDYVDVPRWLAAGYPALFAHPRLGDRLAVLRVSRALGLLDDHPGSAEAVQAALTAAP